VNIVFTKLEHIVDSSSLDAIYRFCQEKIDPSTFLIPFSFKGVTGGRHATLLQVA